MRNDNETTNEILHALWGVYDYDYIIQQPYDMVACDRRNVDVRQTQGAINAWCDKRKVRQKQGAINAWCDKRKVRQKQGAINAIAISDKRKDGGTRYGV